MGWRQRWSGMRARPSQARQNRVVAARRSLASSRSPGRPGPRPTTARSTAARPRAARGGPGPGRPRRPAPCWSAAGASGRRRWRRPPAGPRRPAPRRPRCGRSRRRARTPARPRPALQATDRPHQQVVGVVVGRGPGVRRDLVLALTRAHRQGVADLDPAGRGLPGRDQGVGPGLVGPRRRDVDAERPQPEQPGLAVEQRAEHARRVEPGHAQPVHAAVGGDQRAGVAVGQEGVAGDRGERRGHGRALEPLGSGGDGGGPDPLSPLGRAHGVTHGPRQPP